MEQEKDIVLIEKALKGSDDAFAQLFHRNYPFLFKYLLKLTLNEEMEGLF